MNIDYCLFVGFFPFFRFYTHFLSFKRRMQKTGLIYLSMDMIGHKILFKVRHYKELPQLITYIKTLQHHIIVLPLLRTICFHSVCLSSRLHKKHPPDFYEAWIGHGSQYSLDRVQKNQARPDPVHVVSEPGPARHINCNYEPEPDLNLTFF